MCTELGKYLPAARATVARVLLLLKLVRIEGFNKKFFLSISVTLVTNTSKFKTRLCFIDQIWNLNRSYSKSVPRSKFPLRSPSQ